MSELSLNEQEFTTKCSESKDALLSLIESFHRNAAFGINNNQSFFQAEAIDTLGRAYCQLYNTIVQAVTTMSIDWNIIETCGLEIASFDRYLGSCINPSNATPYYYDACNDLLNSRSAYDVDYSDLIIDENSFPNYRSDTDWIIFHGNIQTLERMKQYVEEFIPACDNYQTVLSDFIDGDSITGQLGDAIRNYLTRVHQELLNYIKLVSEQLKDAINQYCIQYRCTFPEDGFLLNKSELTDDIIALETIAGGFNSLISRARSTITVARNELNGSGITHPYNPISISSRHPSVFESKINVAINRIREVVNSVDENEERGRYLADDAENDIIHLKATIDYIQPIGGQRVFHYCNNNASDLLDVPNVEDVTEIEIQEAVYNTEAEYYLSAVRDADPADLPDAIEATRVHLSTLLPEGLELSDELILNITEYYYSLIADGWSPDQALAIVLYAITDYSDLLAEGDYEELDNTATATCPEPSVVSTNAANLAMQIANDPSHGYDQDTREGGIDYDCSSLVMSVYIASGAPGLSTWATPDMQLYLSDSGFESIGNTNDSTVPIEDLRPGDILLCNGHTEIYVGNGYTVSASSNESRLYHNQGQHPGDSRQTIEGNTEPDINDPNTLDTIGEIRFENVNVGGFLERGRIVYRYTGV